MQRQQLRGLDESAVGVAVEIRLLDAVEMPEHVPQLRASAVQAREQRGEDAQHRDPALAGNAIARHLDREEVARAAVEVRDEDVLEALGRERASEILDHGDRGRGPERERARLRHRIRRGIHARELQERALPMPLGQEAQHALGQSFPLEHVRAER